MNLLEIKALIEAEFIGSEDKLLTEINAFFAADLMSDVLYYAKPGSMLLTGLVNALVIRTAYALDLPAVVHVRGRRPPTETIALAAQLDIPLLVTPYILYETCGRLYAWGDLPMHKDRPVLSG